jgi:hypothetical protein
MKRIILLLVLAMPVLAQYRILACRSTTGPCYWLVPGTGLKISVTASGSTIDAVPSVTSLPEVYEFLMTDGQNTVVLAAPGTNPIKVVLVYKRAVGVPVVGAGPNALTLVPDYTTTADKQTVVLASNAGAGDILVVLAWR